MINHKLVRRFIKQIFSCGVLIFYTCWICLSVFACEIRVATPFDLTKPLGKIKTEYEKIHQGCFIELLTINQSDLYKTLRNNDHQIDVIVWDDYSILFNLSKIGLLSVKTIQKLAQDNLCVVVKKSIVMRPFMLYPQTSVVKGLLIGNSKSSALGAYTKEALSKLGLWKKFSSNLIFLENNTYIENSVREGNFDGGIIYCSSAQSAFVQITDILNPILYHRIIYASAITKKSSFNQDIISFNKFLISKKAKEIFKQYHLMSI